MSVGPVVTDKYFEKFIAVTNTLKAEYTKHSQSWTESPFAWMLTLPSRTRGAVGEKIVSRWLIENGCTVDRAPHSGCDRVVNGVNLEIKFSTLWEGGQYCFQQLRDQDYAFVFCLGIAPHEVQAWIIPKTVAWNHAISQHGGKSGTDTRWLTFQADSIPDWLAPYGGPLKKVIELIQSRKLF